MTVQADPGSKPENFNDKDVSIANQTPVNRGKGEPSPPASHEFAVGNREEHSGVNQEQVEQAAGTPGKR